MTLENMDDYNSLHRETAMTPKHIEEAIEQAEIIPDFLPPISAYKDLAKKEEFEDRLFKFIQVVSEAVMFALIPGEKQRNPHAERARFSLDLLLFTFSRYGFKADERDESLSIVIERLKGAPFPDQDGLTHLQNLRSYRTGHEGGAVCGAKVSDSKITSTHEIARGGVTCVRCLTIYTHYQKTQETAQ